MKNVLTIVIVGVLLVLPSALFAEIPSIHEFMSPAADQPSKGIKAPQEVENPDAIKVSKKKVLKSGDETTVVEAATTQDAINKVIELQRELEPGIIEIQVGSGRGIVATGVSNYNEYRNRNASILSKRQAYVKAFTYAKKHLAEHLNGLTSDAKEDLVEVMGQVDTDEESLVNSGAVSLETIDQQVEGILRGFTVYSVDDNAEKKEVTVSIVTTPKTRGETMKYDRNTIITTDPGAAQKELLVKLSTGFLPPIGSQLISVQPGNELWFCGYGSAVIKTNKNRAVQRKLKSNALKIARMRAADALIGMIIGDETYWKGGLTSGVAEELKQFDTIEQEDPTSGKTSLDIKGLDSTKKTLESRMVNTDTYKSARKGSLPPGLIPLTWVDDSGDWACAVYIYNQHSSQQARKVQKVMTSGPSILKKSGSYTRTTTSETSNEEQGEVYRDNRPVGRGPSGQVSTADEL